MTMNSSKDITFKKIVFKGGDKLHSYETNADNVIVYGSTGKHDHGSSKIKLKNIVDYKWEVKNYMGRLIAIHIGGKYVAYAIKVNSKELKPEGMVRVVSPVSGHRALIRGMSNEVLDLQFAHMKSQIVLASIEEVALHIHKIEMVRDNIICTLLLKIEDPIVGHVPKYDKINWCPYVPENEYEIDNSISQLIVWTRGSSYQCYNVHSVVETYGVGTRRANEIIEGSLQHSETSPITGATLSPDGTTLAISFEDGNIRFYQVYFHSNDEAPRCLHQWVPHQGKPVSGLFFLDNHSEYSEDNSLWKHAITTADNNTEIKVWSCATWECLQTIAFKSNTENELYFKAEIDPTSSYLVLTDTISRGLYVLQVIQNTVELSKGENGSKSGDDDHSTSSGETTDVKSTAYIKSISEFALSSSILSFGIIDATVRKYKCAYNDIYLLEELDDYDEDTLNRYCVVIHLYLVQPKSVQECHVLYQPSVSINADVGSSLSASESGDKPENLLDTISAFASPKEKEKLSLDTTTVEPATQQLLNSIMNKSPADNKLAQAASTIITKPAPLSLMTPDSFHSYSTTSEREDDTENSRISDEIMEALKSLARNTNIVAKKPISAVSPEIKNAIKTVKSVESVSLLDLVNNKSIEEQEKQSLLRQSAELKAAHPIVPPMPPTSMLVSAAGVSGGSSPSREVQEILSLKDSDCMNDFYHDSEEIQDETDGSGNNVDVPDALDNDDNDENDDNDDIDENDDNDENDDENEKNSKTSEDGDDTEDAKDDETYTLNEVNAKDVEKYGGQSKESQNNCLTKNDWPNVPDVKKIQAAQNHLFKKSSSPINDISYKLDQLLETIQTQNCQISELRSEILTLRQTRIEETNKFDALGTKIEYNLSKMLENYLNRYEREHNKKLEAFLTGRDTQNRELHDSITRAVTQTVCSQLSNVLINEIQKHALPIVAGKLEGIKTQIQSDIAQKITITDHVIKENISNICRSKETLEVFGASVAIGVKSAMHQSYTEALQSIIIPAYEKANSELFKQLYETFNKGTVAYANQLSAYTKMYEPIHNELVVLMRSVPDQLKQLTDSSVSSCTQKVSNDINKDLKAMQANLLKTLKDNLKNEIQKGFESQTASLEDSVLMAVRSQAQTPAPSIVDVQEQIKHLLQQGQTNKAFHQALLANDLHLVQFALERSDFKSVFNPCPLEQTVLLSLIQQISADMSNHNELKQKYLAAAIFNLNERDSITKEHSPKVMKELQINCQNFIQTNPNSPLNTEVGVLIMAAEGVISKLM